MWSLTRLLMSSPATRGTTLSIGRLDSIHTSCACEAARRMTQERKRKITMANARKNIEWYKKNPKPLPAKMRLMLLSKGINPDPKPLRADEKNFTFPTDDVYPTYKFCYARMSVAEALEELKCHYHPDFLNRMEDFVQVKVEFDMRATKNERYLDEFEKMVPIVHGYDSSMRPKNVCVLVEDEAERERALNNGAFMAGGLDFIKEIVKGRQDVWDVDHFVCHEDLIANLKPLAGILREKLPSRKEGTVDSDVVKLLRAFRFGYVAKIKKVTPGLGVAVQPDYGYAEIPIGLLSQDPNEVEENLTSVLQALLEHAPKRKGGFITRASLELEGGPHYASFSVEHPLIYDQKLKEHKKSLTASE